MFDRLLPKIGTGVFVTCSDDFLVYDIGDDHEKIQFAAQGFTALAHPSSLQVGTGHGVYVIKDTAKIDPDIPLQEGSCHQVLQKPSIETMYAKNAVLSDLHKKFSVCDNDIVAYTDSSFFFSHDVTRKFLTFMESYGNLTCEVDAYGDFLQALGPGASDEYTSNTGNVSTITPDLITTRQQVFSLLKGTPLKLLLMNASKFVHIGTTQEYINYFCCDSGFQSELGLGKDVFNVWGKGPADMPGAGGEGQPMKRLRLSDTSEGCVMHSIIPHSSVISRTAVVEYCHFDIPVKVGQNSILSNLAFVERENCLQDAGKCLDIPHNMFIHTIPVFDDDSQTKYVTVFFDIQDSLKKVSLVSDIKQLNFLGSYVEQYLKVVHLDLAVATPKGDTWKPNLWHARLFPLMPSPRESLTLTLDCIQAVKTDDSTLVSLADKQVLSMADILRKKDVNSMLKKRNDLYKNISAE